VLQRTRQRSHTILFATLSFVGHALQVTRGMILRSEYFQPSRIQASNEGSHFRTLATFSGKVNLCRSAARISGDVRPPARKPVQHLVAVVGEWLAVSLSQIVAFIPGSQTGAVRHAENTRQQQMPVAQYDGQGEEDKRRGCLHRVGNVGVNSGGNQTLRGIEGQGSALAGEGELLYGAETWKGGKEQERGETLQGEGMVMCDALKLAGES